jgi:hypothetical protein
MSDHKYTAAEHVIASKVGDESVLLNTENDKTYGLNRVASLVWEAVTADAQSAAELTMQVTDRYDVDASRAASDIAALLAQLRREGLICISE